MARTEKVGRLITMQEIADKSGYSYWYVRALACGSEVKKLNPMPRPYTKLGRRKLWRELEIDEWLKL